MNSGLHLKMLDDLKKHLSNKQTGFLSKQVSECGIDSKKLYALVFSLTNTIHSNPLPECDSFDTLT